MILPTPQNSPNSRRQERRLQSAERVVGEMRRGKALHCYFDPHEGLGAIWNLSCGRRVSNKAAELAIRDPHIVPVDSSLFPGLQLFSQAYRFTAQRRKETS
jgi:hypothetical protein